jgi:hypothetical protein
LPQPNITSTNTTRARAIPMAQVCLDSSARRGRLVGAARLGAPAILDRR